MSTDTPDATAQSTAATVSVGQTWGCNEARADLDDVPEPHGVLLWEPHPRFRAVVDHVDGQYVELTVVGGNDHPRTPEFGASVATSTDSLRGKPRWSKVGGSS